MSIHPSLSPQLHLITGKGGVGRTSVAISLAKAFVMKGEQVLILEAQDEEGGGSALGRALGLGESIPSVTQPKRISTDYLKQTLSPALHTQINQAGSLYVGQLIAREGHERFLSSLLPVERLIKAALQSQGLSRFLSAAPSMYELGLFYHLWSTIEGGRFSKIVMDLPATGHTLALTRLPGQIERMVPMGPVTEALRQGRRVISNAQEASMWVVAIPERLPVSEALDLSAELKKDGFRTAGFILNRVPLREISPKIAFNAHQQLHQIDRLGSCTALKVQFERAYALPTLTQTLASTAPVFYLHEAFQEAQRTDQLLGWFENHDILGTQQCQEPSTSDHDLQTNQSLLAQARALSATHTQDTLKEALLTKEVIVCCGAGGVGKTTTSAALALAAAQLGRRVLVLTIDPSKRLAQALGVSQNTPTPVMLSKDRLTQLGVTEGALSAWLLDPQHVSDGVVLREASAQASELMSNLIYREISGMVAGMQEYTAVEALRGFVQDQAYDLVVLDTPPARHALRFLDAPERVAAFLDKRIFKLFVPDRTGLVGRLAGKVIDEVLERAFGTQLKDELKQFFELFSQILDHLNANQQEMKIFFRSSKISFYLVTSAHIEVLAEAQYFKEQVKERGLSFGGVFLNRDPLFDEHDSFIDLKAILQDLSIESEHLIDQLIVLYQQEQQRLQDLAGVLTQLSHESNLIRVPDLGPQASKLEGLAALAQILSGIQS